MMIMKSLWSSVMSSMTCTTNTSDKVLLLSHVFFVSGLHELCLRNVFVCIVMHFFWPFNNSNFLVI